MQPATSLSLDNLQDLGAQLQLIPEQQLNAVAEDLVDFALLRGLIVRSKKQEHISRGVEALPLALIPFPQNRETFRRAEQTVPLLNLLLYRVANDHDFLSQCLGKLCDDPYISRMWNLYLRVRQDPRRQKVTMFMLRNDLMPTSDGRLLQTEYNLYATGVYGFCGPIATLQRRALRLLGVRHDPDRLEDSAPANRLAEALIHAWQLYGVVNAVVVEVADEEEALIFHQRYAQFKAQELEPRISWRRRTFRQLAESATLVGDDRRLMVDGEEVAVIHFRTGAMASYFDKENLWEIRETLEMSHAIKVPSVHVILANTKAVQQRLSLSGVIEQFMSDVEDKDGLRAIHAMFGRQYLLNGVSLDAETQHAVADALRQPEEYVLKPAFAEGGLHNMFGTQLREHLQQRETSNSAFTMVLQERFHTALYPQLVVHSEKSPDGLMVEYLPKCDAEIGFFGLFVSDSNEKLITNEYSGYGIRIKPAEIDEEGAFTRTMALAAAYFTEE